MPKPLNVNEVVSQYNKLKSSSSGGADYVKIDSGSDVIVRLVTWVNEEEDQEQLNVEFSQNYLPQIKRSFVDPVSFGGSKSPISKFVTFASKKGMFPEDVINRMKDRRRIAFLVIHEGKYKILEAPVTLATAIMAIFANEDYGNIAHEKTGREIKIKKSGTGLDTKYEAHPRPESKPVPKNVEGTRLDLYGHIKSKVNTEQELIDTVEETFKVDYEAEVLTVPDDAPDETRVSAEWNTDYSRKELKGKTLNQLKNIAKQTAKENDNATVNSKWNAEQLINFIVEGVEF